MNTTDLDNPAYRRQLLARLRQYYSGRVRPTAQWGMRDGLDIDLLHLGWLQLDERNYHRLTEAGVAALGEARQENKRRQNGHDSLAERLARHLRDSGRLVWLNKELKAEHDGERRPVRPDVYSLRATLNPAQICPMVHEIKVSRADFLADVGKAEKRAGYRSLADYVHYVAPEGLLDPGEIPEGCGLLVERADGSFWQQKRARKSPTTLPASVWMALLLKQDGSDNDRTAEPDGL